jgi:hypothetical protein
MTMGKFNVLFKIFFFVMSFDLSYSQFRGYYIILLRNMSTKKMKIWRNRLPGTRNHFRMGSRKGFSSSI